MKNVQKCLIILLLIVVVVACVYIYIRLKAPVIISINPTSGSYGVISVTGKGFTSADNKLLLEYNSVNYSFGLATSSLDSTTLSFDFGGGGWPDSFSCPDDKPCMPPPTEFPAGTYKIFIKDANGTSNKVSFNLTKP